ncbi:hypothetical protein PN36_11190 [Candidatus Thiomargarita nelsonii]|uniref:Alpha/beta hydrolase n=1 Tax=Candidatus Thiomargarita nelsonii TaxID=1003181 RepID=A0A4E0QUG4_9GAMM|nr:hypothetical protein PN36_11190 [Candidatus Thiomargarita nelsonii]
MRKTANQNPNDWFQNRKTLIYRSNALVFGVQDLSWECVVAQDKSWTPKYLFVHGFGKTAERWDDIKPFFHLLELQFGGILQISKRGNVSTSDYNKAADYFFISTEP